VEEMIVHVRHYEKGKYRQENYGHCVGFPVRDFPTNMALLHTVHGENNPNYTSSDLTGWRCVFDAGALESATLPVCSLRCGTTLNGFLAGTYDQGRETLDGISDYAPERHLCQDYQYPTQGHPEPDGSIGLRVRTEPIHQTQLDCRRDFVHILTTRTGSVNEFQSDILNWYGNGGCDLQHGAIVQHLNPERKIPCLKDQGKTVLCVPRTSSH
jgi:hypothetical protein